MDFKHEESSNEPLMEGAALPSRWTKFQEKESAGRFSLSTLCLVLAATNLITIIVGLAVYARSPATLCEREEVPWFGKIPYKNVLWEVDDRFVDTNPKVFYNQTTGDAHSAWSEIYPSGWVLLSPQPGQPLEGGAPLSHWGSDQEHWPEESQAWATTLMHQIHCLGTVKSAFHQLQEGIPLDKEREGHVPHCIEYFRQSFLCSADLTIEPPMDPLKWPQGTSGWGNVHQCRDWDVVLEALKDRSLLREGGRWVRLRHE